jgi:hypothetical protein
MAAFRGITAEEEAASGLIFALQHRGYDNAQLLNPRNHVHKSAVIPFLDVLGRFFHEVVVANGIVPKLHLDEEEGVTQLRVAVPIVAFGVEKWAYPIPPLNFSVKSDERSISYKKQIESFLTDQNAKNMAAFVREQANKRNHILYASPDGYPAVESLKEDFFTTRKRRVIVMLCGYLLIEPYVERQLFVQGALDAYLAMLDRVSSELLHPEV